MRAVRTGLARWLAAGACVLPVTAAATGLEDGRAVPTVPFPAVVESVIEQGAIDGHPVVVLRFVSRLPVEQALAAARRAWSRNGTVPLVASASGSWQLLSTREPHAFLTLQVRAARAGSEGALSAWPDTPAAREPAGEVARLLPAGATVLRRIEGLDAGRRHRSFIALAPGSPEHNADLVIGTARAAGFTHDTLARTPAPGGTGRALHFRAAGREAGVTLHRHADGTAIVLHLVETAQ